MPKPPAHDGAPRGAMPAAPLRGADLAAALVARLESDDPRLGDTPLEDLLGPADHDDLAQAAAALDRTWRATDNLYRRVRALLELYALHRFYVPRQPAVVRRGRLPVDAIEHLRQRRFEQAVDRCLAAERKEGTSAALSSALAEAYRGLAFDTLAQQVRASVRSSEGNGWLFDDGVPPAGALRLPSEWSAREQALVERTPVRLDLTHSSWSDIFFLAMDRPEWARVLNVSVDLGVRGRDAAPEPPIEARLELTDTPGLELVSRDLQERVRPETVADLFDFAADHLGLLKAAVIAAGWVPPALEGQGERALTEVLGEFLGGRGARLSSWVRGIPKGSRLAVSTNLLGALIAVLMRASGQTERVTGPLTPAELRQVAGRAILGEWLGGSGGGWQDSGGLWPGFKRIEGAVAEPGDPEFGTSHGRLLPRHTLLGLDDIGPQARERFRRGVVLVHGGMSQNVGPILELVTEKYLLRAQPAWDARQESLSIYAQIGAALAAGDLERLGQLTEAHFRGPLATIVPEATNAFTERLIERVRSAVGDSYYGFLMLGGLSGGGMAFLVDPEQGDLARERIATQLAEAKAEFEHALPFVMEPVVYDFEVNEVGTQAHFEALSASDGRVSFAAENPAPDPAAVHAELSRLGFDRERHEALRGELLAGRVGLARNRLPSDTRIHDARAEDVKLAWRQLPRDYERAGRAALERGEVGVVVLAGGAGTRWSRGAGVAKALHPFAKLAGRHRSFLEVHLAKARRTSAQMGATVPVVLTTSHLTDAAIRETLEDNPRLEYDGPLFVSTTPDVGLRLIPTADDLRFAFEEEPRQRLDAQGEKLLKSAHDAQLAWAEAMGPASDYTDNRPAQCLHPLGHFYELPGLLLNGTLQRLLAERPGLQTLLLHNLDTVGADVDPSLLGLHRLGGKALTFELIARKVEDTGGGLARVDGRPRLVERLALPEPDQELRLSYYSSMTTWIELDRWLALFGLDRASLDDRTRVRAAIRELAARLPRYAVLKHIRRNLGGGHEDLLPVLQVEQLWGDLTLLPDVEAAYAAVRRRRGGQLKEPAQLDAWLCDGSAEFVEGLCTFR